jgi:PKD repeat protein
LSWEKARQIRTILALTMLVLAGLVACSNNPAPEVGSSPTHTTSSSTPAPEARFSVTPTTGYVPLGVQFIDRSIGNIDTWQWDFNNDGIVDSTVRNPWYTYKDVGNYTVSLAVSGPDGSDTAVKTAFIEVSPHPGLANFRAEPTYGDGATTVQFTDMSTGNITSWAWDFESDGIVDSTEQNPTHTYTEKRKYSVTLTVTANGITDTTTKPDYINLSGCPS